MIRYCPLLCVLALCAPICAHAQDIPQGKPEERPTGLPTAIDWKFNFDAGWGGFGFGNSLFSDPKEHVPQNYGQRWSEGFVKPALGGSFDFDSGGVLYGKLSVVGERTYAKPPPLVGPVESSFLPEDLYVGWRSGKSVTLGENVLDFTIGRAPYTIGHGFLLWDGAAEGGSRGGYWSNARKAWKFAAVARFKPGSHTFEGFYLKRDNLPENDPETRLWGANYEFRVGETTTLGGTYMKTNADVSMSPLRHLMDVYNARAYTAPFPAVKDLSFEFEYAAERNHDLLRSDAWTGQGSYQLSDAAWRPKVTYRYARFEGDDPSTSRSEAFDPLFLGFSDWGAWWQGEIAGEYFVSNSNLQSHQVRAHFVPSDTVGFGAIVYKFLVDRPASYGPGVTDKDLALETDGYVDWKINKNFTASFVLAYADPQGAVQQSSGRTKSFRYGMVFLAYSY